MKKIKYYTLEEAQAIIATDETLKVGLEKLRPEYEDENRYLDYGLEHANFATNIDDEDNTICIFWFKEDDVALENEYSILVDTLEQAIVIVRDIEEAHGNIEP